MVLSDIATAQFLLLMAQDLTVDGHRNLPLANVNICLEVASASRTTTVRWVIAPDPPYSEDPCGQGGLQSAGG
jgi:hypothetical protein